MECSVSIDILRPSIFYFVLQPYPSLLHSDPKNSSGRNFISAFQEDRKGYARGALSTNSTEKLLVAKLIKKSSLFYGTRWFITVSTTACHWTLI
jgi:hypothetical protein